jgi:hypothetical protein
VSRYRDDPTYFSFDRAERAKIRRRDQEAIKRYASTHSAEETKRHVKAMRYPSGRWSHGGANRSSNIKRVIGERTITVTLCAFCRGVTDDVTHLTTFLPRCHCDPTLNF